MRAIGGPVRDMGGVTSGWGRDMSRGGLDRGASLARGTSLLAVGTGQEWRGAGRNCAENETTVWPGPAQGQLRTPWSMARAGALLCGTGAHLACWKDLDRHTGHRRSQGPGPWMVVLGEHLTHRPPAKHE